MSQELLAIGVGLAVLFGGAEALVRGSSALALRAGITPLVVGLTVVAFGTSSPELVVSVQAAAQGNGGIAIGNVVGSNIANVALILGIAAVIRPLRARVQLLRVDVPIMIAASLLMSVLLWRGGLGRLGGTVLLALLLAYVLLSIRLARRETSSEVSAQFAEGMPIPSRRLSVDLALVVVGLGLLAGGAHLLVQGAVAVATQLGVSQVVIGLTVVAVGTSLPELATSTVAALRGESDIALGNVIGSNIFNLFGILGSAALIVPLTQAALSSVDLVAMNLFALALVPIMANRVLSRGEGVLLLAAYGAYLYSLFP